MSKYSSIYFLGPVSKKIMWLFCPAWTGRTLEYDFLMTVRSFKHSQRWSNSAPGVNNALDPIPCETLWAKLDVHFTALLYFLFLIYVYRSGTSWHERMRTAPRRVPSSNLQAVDPGLDSWTGLPTRLFRRSICNSPTEARSICDSQTPNRSVIPSRRV